MYFEFAFIGVIAVFAITLAIFMVIGTVKALLEFKENLQLDLNESILIMAILSVIGSLLGIVINFIHLVTKS